MAGAGVASLNESCRKNLDYAQLSVDPEIPTLTQVTRSTCRTAVAVQSETDPRKVHSACGHYYFPAAQVPKRVTDTRLAIPFDGPFLQLKAYGHLGSTAWQ
jgi:hypothetical protein